jgi:hypothetical protein
MPRAPTFKQRDVAAAIKAARAAGCVVNRIEIDPITGKISVVMGTGEIKEASDLDKWLAQHAS